MGIKVMRHEGFKDKVLPSTIHGKYPYKAYLEIRGNSNFGSHLVVISKDDISKSGLDEISIRVKGKSASKSKTSEVIKPNTSNNGFYINYKVREISILDIQDVAMYVFKVEGEEI